MLTLLALIQFALPVDTALLYKVADAQQVPRQVALAVAWMETRTGTKGNSYLGPGREQCDSTGCHRVCREVGRYQVNPCISFNLEGCKQLRILEQNITCGMGILRYLYSRDSSWTEAIRRYNGSGPRAREYQQKALAYIGWLSLRGKYGTGSF